MLGLVENPDILRSIGKKRGKILVGFALETESLERNAIKKLKEKKLDIIVANKLKRDTNLFGDNLINILIIDKHGNREKFYNLTKNSAAKIILDKVFNFKI